MSARLIAHILLFLFLAAFIVVQCVAPFPYKELVTHFIEGGLVGALADWFAVTALFRHPLGIPFPHSAIIVRKQKALAHNLGIFIEEKFLSEEIISKKLGDQKVTERIAMFLNQEHFRKKTAAALEGIAVSLRDIIFNPTLSSLVSKGITDTLAAYPLDTIVIGVKSIVTSDEYFNPILDKVLAGVSKIIEEQKDEIRGRVKQSLPWFVPSFVDEKLYELLIKGLREFITEIQQTPQHSFRLVLRNKMYTYFSDPATLVVAEQLRTDVLQSSAWKGFLESWFLQIKERGFSSTTPSAFTPYIEEILGELGKTLSKDDSNQQEIEKILHHAVLVVSQQGKGIIRELITDTLQQWDTKTLISSIESNIGDDLQFIRINGTVLGGVIGIILFMLQALFSPYQGL